MQSHQFLLVKCLHYCRCPYVIHVTYSLFPQLDIERLAHKRAQDIGSKCTVSVTILKPQRKRVCDRGPTHKSEYIYTTYTKYPVLHDPKAPPPSWRAAGSMESNNLFRKFPTPQWLNNATVKSTGIYIAGGLVSYTISPHTRRIPAKP